jgi:drug/metabolite transporter (DMT)-like permease
MADIRSTEMPNPYEPPNCVTDGRGKRSSAHRRSARPSLKSLVLLLFIGVAWLGGTDAGSRIIWSAVYPPKDPAHEMFWAHLADLALGIALYAVFERRLQRPRLSTAVVAVVVAFAVGFVASLAAVNLAIWLRPR